MENNHVDNIISGLISRAVRINDLYLLAAGIALIIVTLKFQGKNKSFEFKGITFRLNHYWILASAFTITHIYYAFLFITACKRISKLSSSEKEKVFDTLTYSKAPFIFQDWKKLIHTKFDFLYKLDFTSPASILLIGILALMVITIIKVEKKTISEKIGYWLIAYLLLIINYYVGGWWMIELSKSLS